MVTLPDCEWRQRPGLDVLTNALGADAGMARFVGGAVRDALLGVAVADLDIATRHSPETVQRLLDQAGIRNVPTGLDHGTITAVLESGPVEVTTLRRDVATDGRRAEIAYTDDWREDAARRDFTINALYADPASGAVFDYFGGLDDLAIRHVRFIGEPLQRIAEDHLRILRFFRFLARFGDTADPAGLAACTERARDLMALSRERIADELLKLLVARDAPRVAALMVEQGIFVPVLPEIGAEGADRMRALAEAEAAAGISPDPIRRLSALLPPDPDAADQVGARLKLSRVQRKRLIQAATSDPASPRALAYRLGTEGAVDRMLLDGRDAAEVAAIAHWPVPRFPVSGGAIVARGVRAGPDVARLRRAAEDQWVAEGFPDQDRAEAITEAIVGQALRDTRNA